MRPASKCPRSVATRSLMKSAPTFRRLSAGRNLQRSAGTSQLKSATRCQRRNAGRLVLPLHPFPLAHAAFVAQVPHQKCWDEPREHCTQKTVSCTDLISKISCSGARGKEGLCANQEGSKLPQEVVKKSTERRMKSTERLVCHCENFTS